MFAVIACTTGTVPVFFDDLRLFFGVKSSKSINQRAKAIAPIPHLPRYQFRKFIWFAGFAGLIGWLYGSGFTGPIETP